MTIPTDKTPNLITRFTYTDEQRDQIRRVVRDALGLDADQLQIATLRYGEQNVCAIHSLWGRMEAAAGMYLVNEAAKRHSLPRNELFARRQQVEKLQSEIKDTFAVPVPDKHFKATILLPGVNVRMLDEIDNDFRKWLSILDRLIEQAGKPSDNARKIARNHYWKELLAIWRALGGKKSGKWVTNFLIAASEPVMPVPDPDSVKRSLGGRGKTATANKVTKPVLDTR